MLELYISVMPPLHWQPSTLQTSPSTARAVVHTAPHFAKPPSFHTPRQQPADPTPRILPPPLGTRPQASVREATGQLCLPCSGTQPLL